MRDLRITCRFVNTRLGIGRACQELTLPASTVVAGFGKGSWKLEGKDADINTSTGILFTLESATDKVFVGSDFNTVADHVAARRAKNPLAKLMYHSMTESGTSFTVD